MRKASKLLVLALCVSLGAASLGGCSSKKADSEKTEEKKDAQDSEKIMEVDPVIENAASYIDLADYKTIELEKSEIDKELQSRIDQELTRYASYKKIKKGKVKSGDIVNIYYVGRMDGEAFEGGSCTKENYPNGYDLTIGSNSFIDGFEEALIGKTVGKTYDIDVTFPEDYKNNTDLAGKAAVFTVTLNYLRGDQIKSEFNDKFVKTNLTTYSSAKDYKSKNRKTIIRSMAVEKVCKDTTVNDYPDHKVDEMATQLKTSINSYLTQNNMALSDYLESNKLTEETYEQQVEETSKEDVGNQIVYNAIAQAEDIKVTDEEYQTELKTYLTNYNCTEEAELDKTFNSYYGTTARNIIYNELLYSKVADYLVDNVKEV